MGLFKEHHILSQVTGHGMNVIKMLPFLNLTDKDCRAILDAFDQLLLKHIKSLIQYGI